ncbi:sugar phosphate isomerase/epimerase [Chryseobacterium chendengshani]|uniref:sugar phosphate isomerase/epimerase family protein n=1 Tax=Chryseobacterium sp. LJ668 TaxID=2864040 RepID=UPI001C68F2D0|nr:sugar phosphate isomerase/epimerase [Chryseobacterium sp. LJ668]MBW8523038.1 sugar phosphate isomerase/epimerase [Chryseobacterium sp. LJ668]QYK16566.1 sugar phosphate isomerase/epimerase [Chryseobacterium sp. LJ668]
MKRIDFLKLSSLGLLGLYSFEIANSFNKNKRLAIQLYTIRDAISQNLEKALEKIAALGYTDLEIYGYNGTFFGKNRIEFLSVLNNTGLKVISSHHQTGVLKKEKGTLSHHWEQSVEDLSFIGSKYIVCSYLNPEERTSEHYRKLPELLDKSAETSKQYKIQFAYHNHDFEFEKMDEEQLIYDFILKNTSADLVKMELDLYWITKADFDPLDYFEKYPGRFPLWHVKDMHNETKNFAEVGSGTIDFKRIFEARKKAGLDYWFVEQDSSNRDIFESILMSKKYIDENDFFFK